MRFIPMIFAMNLLSTAAFGAVRPAWELDVDLGGQKARVLVSTLEILSQAKDTAKPAASTTAAPNQDATKTAATGNTTPAKAAVSKENPFGVQNSPARVADQSTPIPLNETVTLKVDLVPVDKSKSLEKFDLAFFNICMPEHNHCMRVERVISPLGVNSWKVQSALLHMKGKWQLSVELRETAPTKGAAKSFKSAGDREFF